MAEILLTFHCASVDRDLVAEALRAASGAPVHVRAEMVRGHDFGDARTAEQVTGNLDRQAVEAVVAEEALSAMVAAVGQAQCRLPVRWRAMPVIGHGRIA